MVIISSLSQFLAAVLVFLIGAAVVVRVGQNFSARMGRSLLIYGWHTLMCLTYLWYALNFGSSDSIGYYRAAVRGGIEFEFGTAGISYLTALLVHGFGLSLLGCFLVYNIFGTIGLLAFDGCLRTATQNKSRNIQRLATLIVFLPSVSFWSSAIGKDALSFMAAGLALWAALDLGRRASLMALAIFVMLLVRPHIAGMMVIGLTFASLLDAKASPGKKLLLSGISVAVGASLVPFALQYAGLGDTVSAESLSSYIERRQAVNMVGGGAVDISSMSLPMQLFTYLFRPTIFEARSVFALAAAIDNLILLYLFIAGGCTFLGRAKDIHQGNRVFMWTYALLAWLVLAMTCSNLGIALRQKWMFVPMLIFLLISVIGRKQEQPGDLHVSPVDHEPLHRSPLDRPKLRRP